MDKPVSRRSGHAFRASIVAALAAAVLSGAALPARAAETWITHPAAVEADSSQKPVALQFRRTAQLQRVPASLPVRVSADNRFILYVNGQRVGQGPARGDLAHWRYQRFDLAPYLKRGRNVVAAQVWNDGNVAALAQVTAKTGFMLAPEASDQSALATGPEWQARVDASRVPTLGRTQISATVGRGFYAAGPPETIDGAKRDWTWLSANSKAKDWIAAAPVAGPPPWTLIPDPLPPMAYTAASMGKIVRAQGATPGSFPERALTIPANSSASILFDAGAVEAAFPELTVSGGKGAEVTLAYTEALYAPDKTRFSDRARVDDGLVLGISDTFQPDGGQKRTFQPFWWRVWRFAEVRIKTGAQPLTLNSIHRHKTGYPFDVRGRFVSDDPELNRIWEIGWNTVRVDAHETYQDSSYWEQLQYIGDTRLQVLITYAMTGDPRLPVQALDAIQDSRINGLPRSAYPSRSQQSIPPFALIGIGMLHDYWMHNPDPAPLKRNLDGMRTTLDWYGRAISNGLVAHTPGWQFIDWRPGLSEMPRQGEPPRPDSCVISLFYVGALKQAADIETTVGDAARAKDYRAAAERSAEAVRTRCWDSRRGLFANTPDKNAFSQHANVLAVLYDVAPKAAQVGILDRVTVRDQGIDAPAGITGSSYYFSFYLVRALEHAGLSERYLDLMTTWRKMLPQNFTTWPENEDPSRSDTHAWSAHPTADLLAVVAGVQPASPGFGAVRVAPHLGRLRSVDAAVAHPQGTIEVSHRLNGDALESTVTLPAGLSGEFTWRGQTVALVPGANTIRITRPAR